MSLPTFPSRYEPLYRLGQGGGGEVWAVRDKVHARTFALKMLAKNAGDAEVTALVREAIALSGLEGLGLPQVVAFGSLPGGGSRYLVRELVEGQSLEEVLEIDDGPGWLEPLANACDVLTLIHRAGFLHGDIKPANIIAGQSGSGTLVDLGLAAPWRDMGTMAQGLTPKFAAPELLRGDPLTVRAEIYALGATLGEALARRGSELSDNVRLALAKVAARATSATGEERYPSIDELANAVRTSAQLAPATERAYAAWPVLGLDSVAQQLTSELGKMPPGAGIAIEGPDGSGRTTLLRRVSWTLGVGGTDVIVIDPPTNGLAVREAVELQLGSVSRASNTEKVIVVVDDLPTITASSHDLVRDVLSRGARLVAIANADVVQSLTPSHVATIGMPPLDAQAAEDLVRRAVPSLPDGVRKELIDRVGARPGPLRAILKRIAGRAIVSREEIEEILSTQTGHLPKKAATISIAALEQLLDQGRFGEAKQALSRIESAEGDEDRVRIAILRARLAIGRGDAVEAKHELSLVTALAKKTTSARAHAAVYARAHMRAGEYSDVLEHAKDVLASNEQDAIAADALSLRGVALALTGEDAGAAEALKSAINLATNLGDSRAEAVALGSSAIAHQRGGRTAEAKQAYEKALAAAERARDAATIATMRLNLASLAQTEGDLANALLHLEAAVDMGRRAGGLLALQQALLNLANLDLYLGRYARARASIDSLLAQKDTLSPNAQAQLLGLEAEYASRTGDEGRAIDLYEQAARGYESQGRTLDAAECRLEGLFLQTRGAKPEAPRLAGELDRILQSVGEKGFGEHEAIYSIVNGSLARLRGDEELARRSLDDAYQSAKKTARREWAWQALDARAKLLAAQGSVALARRDTESALAILEETAAKLPRDLREVFWNDPRRRALRQAHTATLPASNASLLLRTTSGNTSIFAARPAEDRLARILEITRELAREHDIGRLLTRVTDHAIALLGAERGFVLLVNAKGELSPHAARDRAGDDPHARFSHSVAEKVVATGEPVIATSARDDERLAEAVSVHQLMIQSIACVPIRDASPEGRTIGALYVETRLRPGGRFQEEMPTLAAFADQAAIAIENARLLSENRERAEDLAVTNVELSAAKEKLSELLGKRTEQLIEVRRDLKQVRAQIKSHFGYGGLVGTSEVMRRVYAVIDRVKDTDVAVLITGESGTGKEMVAKAIHATSPRAKKPFVGLNCGAIPANLLESELFGSVKGAFTGAERDRRGLFREAEGGTILLDEIGEMPKKMQSGLLRVLQEKLVRPVGGAREEPVNVRVIAATNRDLQESVKDGSFREDLYYRLHVVEVEVPALRDRAPDIPPLIDHFLKLFSVQYRRDRKTIERAAVRKLCAYTWPGNVRQLEHVLLNAWLMSEGDEITADDIELPTMRASVDARSRASLARNKSEYKETERDRILSALTACNWNRVQAAKMIGLPRRTFYRRLKEFGIV